MKHLFLSILLIVPICLFSNNIYVSNVAIESQNLAEDYYMISMDVSWSNSWRTSTYESNWDAAWVFIKYSLKDQQAWDHAFLHYVDGTNDGHVAPSGCTINTANNIYGNTSRGVGVFIYRSSDGIGDIGFEGIQLRWDYGENGLTDDDVIEISVNAIEMVYIPSGQFYAGDGQRDFGQFEAGNTGNPYLITSEASITLGGTNSNNLSNNDAINMLNADDFNYSTTRTLPSDFPKGYDAFYVMKYEASQEQYAEFLRRLTSDQRNERDGPHYVNTQDVFPIKDGNYWAEANHPWRPVFYMSWMDVATYLDWAGLRPMSELEYEKACRGPLTAVPNELAWGNSSWYINGMFEFAFEGTPGEIIINGMGAGVGNANTHSIYSGAAVPVRCGIFAASAVNKTRQETGASYYGVMEMSGNCYEFVISVGNSNTRDFSGNHGDGSITSSGNASFFVLSDWSFASAIGLGYRSSEVSTRYGGNYNDPDRELWHGIRGARSAQ
ncbi:MAG: SUMF1/EgtB/PvdO family nonheme iron enzyme [Bacteroidota bacterium]